MIINPIDLVSIFQAIAWPIAGAVATFSICRCIIQHRKLDVDLVKHRLMNDLAKTVSGEEKK